MKRIIFLIFILIFIEAIAWTTYTLAQQKKMTEIPIGKARSAEEFSKDADYLIEARRSAVSDGESAILFKPSRCVKCHDNKPGVEGQIFYNYPDFKKEVDWPDYIAHPDRKHAPSLDYDFFDMHAGKKKRLPMTRGQDIDQRMKQMQ